MTNEDMSYDRSAYLRFREIQENAFRTKVKFVLEQRDQINKLRYRDKQFIELDFLICLFEIGDYERYLEFVDKEIESVIRNNIFRFKEKDIYYHLLQCKALALFNLFKDQECLKLTKEICAINGNSKIPRIIILKLMKRKKRKWSIRLNGLSIGLILMTAVILFVELIVIRPFYPEHSITIEMFRNTTILAAFSFLIVKEILVYLFAHHETNKLVK